MDDITVEDFRALLPQFADAEKYPDALIQMYIDLAVQAFDQCYWGARLQVGEAMWIAHWLTVTTPGISGTAPIAGGVLPSSKKVGDTAVSYSDAVNQMLLENPFYRTGYGQAYMHMIEMLGPTIMIV
jgi:Protein of unknown function (DUF4054)